jgi:hypothetical protein
MNAERGESQDFVTALITIGEIGNFPNEGFSRSFVISLDLVVRQTSIRASITYAKAKPRLQQRK